MMDCSTSRKRRFQPNIIVAACGCIDAVKFGLVCHEFSKWAQVKAVVTTTAFCLIDKSSLPNGVSLYHDGRKRPIEESKNGSKLYVELLHWADIMVIAPLSAHTLGKIVGGISNNLLTNIVRGWDYKKKPMFVAPSMEPLMWNNVLTEQHLKKCEKLGIKVIPTVSQSSAEEGEHKIVSMHEPYFISFIVNLSTLR